MMKNAFLSFLMIILNCHAGFSQFAEVSHRGGFSNSFNEFVRGSNGEFVLGNWYEQGNIASLYSVDADSVVWEDGYYNVVWDASQNSLGNFVLLVSSVGCDFLQANQLHRLEISPNGQVISTANYQYTVYGGHGDYGTSVSEEAFYLFRNKIIKIGHDGTMVFQTAAVSGVNYFSTVTEGFNGDLLGFSQNGYMARFDEQGDFIDTTFLSQPILNAEKSPFGKLFGFSNNTVYEIDSNLVLTDVSSPLGLTGNIQDFLIDSAGILILNTNGMVTRIDTAMSVSAQVNLSAALNVEELWQTDSGVYCSGNTGNAGYILRLAEDLNITTDTELDRMTVKNLGVFGGKLCVVGTENYNPHHPATSALLKSFTTDFTTVQLQSDVWLAGLSVDSISSSNSGNTNFTYQYPTVTIVNSGAVPLQSLYLTYHNEPIGSGICEWQELAYEINGLDLGIGQDTSIQLPRIPYISYGSVSGPTEITLCAYAYSPNRKIDLNHDYNKVCSVHYVNVGVEEIEDSETYFYPNPVVDELVIESKNSLAQYQIVVRDVVGRTIAFHSTILEDRFVLNTASWPAGIYVVSVENSTDRIVRKVVKR